MPQFSRSVPNDPSFKSCLLRVPHTFNSKCINEGVDAQVKIVQQLYNSIPLPGIDNLIVEFQTFLIDKKLKADLKPANNVKQSRFYQSDCKTRYIENILSMQISDHRKFIIRLILAPYFVNVQKLIDIESSSRIKEWALKCNTVKKLEPSISYFDDLVDRSIRRAKETGVKPLKFEETLYYMNRELYNLIFQGLSNDL